MKKLAILALGTTVLATPVLAGNLQPVVVEPAPAAPAIIAPVTGDWTGGYVGGQLGYGDLNSDDFDDEDTDGGIYGLQAGYDYDFGQFVLGGELAVDGTSIETDSGAEIDSITRLGARAGADLGQTLVYGALGAAQASTDFGTDTGYYFGGGVEYMVTDSVSVGGEVLSHRFDDFDDTGADFDATTAAAKVNFRF
ncbi:hypothetical protein ATO2_03385 [Roseovarius sp. 22II1-1F6A]|nr:hypothetical protein ATO2_03385 [Roseovarius sp. 22II1-1F6A]